MKNLKPEIIQNLKQLANHYKKTGDQWRSRSYVRAISSLSILDKPITKNITKKELVKLDGVGKSIADKILEFIQSGKIEKIEKVKKEIKKPTTKEEIISSLQWAHYPSGIFGVGPAAAKKLYSLGARSIEDVNKHYRDKLNENQQIGLKYYKELRKPLKRDFITMIDKVIKYIMNKEFGRKNFKMEIAGSYRRKLPESGDIDMLVTSDEFTLSELVDVLVEWGIVTDRLSMKKKKASTKKKVSEKFMGLAHCPKDKNSHFRLDIEFIQEKNWPSAILYFTGSKGFNINMREKAKKLGYKLSEDGLFKNGKQVNVKSEKEIFEKLDMKYIKPSDR